jgi:hypothetical protein
MCLSLLFNRTCLVCSKRNKVAIMSGTGQQRTKEEEADRFGAEAHKTMVLVNWLPLLWLLLK